MTVSVNLQVARPPRTHDELHAFMATVWGFNIPRKRVCPGHCAPFEAVANAYFAESPVACWHASRGLGGKSLALTALGLTEMATLGCSVAILGGSGEQSRRVIEHMGAAWGSPFAPRHLLATDPGRQRIQLTTGATVRAQTCSQKSVRGGHDPRLRIDEVDEVELSVLHAALGQPMKQKGVTSQTVLSSTWQYPDGTMTWALNEAKNKGWPIFTWCWRETVMPHGWLDPVEVERKRLELPAQMFALEVDLQEPSPEGRAFQLDALARMFEPALGVFEGRNGEYIEIEAPCGGRYVHGADWGKKQDWTVIVTIRIDTTPMKMVAFERLARRPWPEMVKRLDDRVKRYGGYALHDGTGLGDVVQGYIESGNIEGQILVGRERQDIFSEYIAAVERYEVVAPQIDFLVKDHRFCRLDDLFRSGSDFHPPDSVVASALAYRAYRRAGSGVVLSANLAERVRERVEFDDFNIV